MESSHVSRCEAYELPDRSTLHGIPRQPLPLGKHQPNRRPVVTPQRSGPIASAPLTSFFSAAPTFKP